MQHESLNFTARAKRLGRWAPAALLAMVAGCGYPVAQPLNMEIITSLRTACSARNGEWLKVAGLVIVRQRPGSAKGFCFLTLEDETGLANVVVTPDMFERNRAVIHTASILMVEGPLQIQEGVIHLRARRFTPLTLPQQTINQTGSGYRMRISPEEEEPSLPKSHDFR